MSYKIYTDSTANLPGDLIEKYNLEVISLDYLLDGQEYKSYIKGQETDLVPFYNMLREKKKITTSCINEATFLEIFEQELQNGNDLIYIGFSSGLSATYDCSKNACETLKAKYPDRKLFVIDSLCASLGLGLLVVNACQQKQNGATIEELASYVEEVKLKVCHLFTVDTLEYLYRGGRVSASKYFITKLANIKPTMRVDDNGKLVAYGKVMGRKKSIHSLINKLEETIVDKENQTIFISHGDCIEDALFAKSILQEKLGIKKVVINYVDSVIGSHSGPGTLALFYFAENRNV